MKVLSIIIQSIIILFRMIVFGIMFLLILAAIESTFGFFPTDYKEVLQAVPQIGFLDIMKKYGHCIMFDNSLIDEYCNALVLGMPLFYLQLVFFGFGYAFQFQWTIKEYRGASLMDTYDGSLFIGIILLVVRIILAFLFLMISPLLMLVLIVMNVKKLVQTIID